MELGIQARNMWIEALKIAMDKTIFNQRRGSGQKRWDLSSRSRASTNKRGDDSPRNMVTWSWLCRRRRPHHHHHKNNHNYNQFLLLSVSAPEDLQSGPGEGGLCWVAPFATSIALLRWSTIDPRISFPHRSVVNPESEPYHITSCYHMCFVFLGWNYMKLPQTEDSDWMYRMNFHSSTTCCNMFCFATACAMLVIL